MGALREPQTHDPDTPEGMVQGYLQAIIGGKKNRGPSGISPRGGHADVRVRLGSAPGPTPFAGHYSFTERFHLVREDGAWRIADVPWPLYDCGAPR